MAIDKQKSDENEIKNLLRVIAALLLREGNGKVLTLNKQIEILDDLGVDYKEIAKIINRNPNYTHREIGLSKKKKGIKKGGKK